MIRARNALRRSRTIPARIVAIPTSRISVGGMRAPWWVEQLAFLRSLLLAPPHLLSINLGSNAELGPEGSVEVVDVSEPRFEPDVDDPRLLPHESRRSLPAIRAQDELIRGCAAQPSERPDVIGW